jgi:hypothetical protein
MVMVMLMVIVMVIETVMVMLLTSSVVLSKPMSLVSMECSRSQSPQL